jgi:hypothetical protein
MASELDARVALRFDAVEPGAFEVLNAVLDV